MVQSKICRIRNLIVFVLVFLFAFNIFVTFKFTKQECHSQPRIQWVVNQKCNNEVIEHEGIHSNGEASLFPRLDLNLGRWDNRRKYKLFDNIIIGKQYAVLSRIFGTCLATQSSLERLSSIVEVARHWNGPISLAVFAAGSEELNNLLLYIAYLRKCDVNIRRKVVFHLAMDGERLSTDYTVDFYVLEKMDCGDANMLKEIVKNLNKKIGSWRTKLAYPQNLLRNLARKNCQTKYVFLTDVDIIPSQGMAEDLDLFLSKATCKGKCAYVIPTYELDTRIQFPANKSELIRLAGKHLARPFHHRVFIYNQFATNFSRWQQNVNDGREVHISHPVTNFEFLYEPFYVAGDEVPPHDERFIGYGYTRNSQVYEMFVAGYEFFVLSPIFTCHWGLQVKSTRPFWREMQNNANRKRFESFKREIFAKYVNDPLNMMKEKKSKKN